MLPQAPNMPVTLNGGMVMPSWYDILDTSIFRRAEDKDGINQVRYKFPVHYRVVS